MTIFTIVSRRRTVDLTCYSVVHSPPAVKLCSIFKGYSPFYCSRLSRMRGGLQFEHDKRDILKVGVSHAVSSYSLEAFINHELSSVILPQSPHSFYSFTVVHILLLLFFLCSFFCEYFKATCPDFKDVYKKITAT